ncbi:response regulator transcription factor [Streptomyces sp. NPDC058653]|uniref:response regulator transcription factor n=1 Tax=Streptomyces sp. NPDC058653 TaxID=3346576 RepID=UPI00365B8FE2
MSATRTGCNPLTPRISVAIHARDPISQAGVVSQLRPRPEVSITEWEAETPPQIVVAVVDTVDEEARRTLRRIMRTSTSRVVLLTTDIDEQKLVSAAEFGVAGVVRRSDATPEHLVDVIGTVARGEGHLPPDLLGSLLKRVGRLQSQVLGPRGLQLTGLTEREIEVLRMVAEGHETSDIATKLGYSERTIKNVLHQVITRLQLSNRAHAVAYAMRQGLI